MFSLVLTILTILFRWSIGRSVDPPTPCRRPADALPTPYRRPADALPTPCRRPADALPLATPPLATPPLATLPVATRAARPTRIIDAISPSRAIEPDPDN